MNYEIKRWKLVTNHLLANADIIFRCLLAIAYLWIFLVLFKLSDTPLPLPCPSWMVSGLLVVFVLITVLIAWQRVAQIRNFAWRVEVDDQGLSLDTLQEPKRLIWQQLSKIEKQFITPDGKFVYKLETINGDKIYIPGGIDSSGQLIEQIKTFVNKAGAAPSFILPERLVVPLRSKIMIYAMLAAIVGVAAWISFWVISKIKHPPAVTFNGYRYGYVDKAGKLVIPAKFDEAEDFSKYGAAVKVGKKWGWINKFGQFIIKPKFADEADAFGDGSSGLVAVHVHGKMGFVNRDGNTVIKPQFDDASGFYNDTADVKIGKKWGCINTKGKFVIKPIFDEMFGPHFDDNGRALVIFRNHVVCIDRKGTILFNTPYTEIYAPYKGLVPVKLNSKWGLMDERGKTLCEPKYDNIDPIDDNRAGFELSGKWGLMDGSGKIICEPKYDWVGVFNNGVASVKLNKKVGYIDRSGQLVFPMQFGDLSGFFLEGLAPVCSADQPNNWIPNLDNWGYIDLKGNYIVKPQYFAADEFSEGLAAVGDRHDKYGFINKSGDIVIKPCFDYAWSFTDGLARVDVNYKDGYINKTGAFVIPPTFDIAYPFSEGLAKVGFVKAPPAKK